MERTVDQDLSLPNSEMAVSCMMTRDWDRKTHGFETINVKIVAKEVRHSFRLHETGLRPVKSILPNGRDSSRDSDFLRRHQYLRRMAGLKKVTKVR